MRGGQEDSVILAEMLTTTSAAQARERENDGGKEVLT